MSLVLFCLFLLVLNNIILQDVDSDIEVIHLLDPSSPERVVGNISIACSVEVWTTSYPFLICWSRLLPQCHCRLYDDKFKH